jgi:hypothetical protein
LLYLPDYLVEVANLLVGVIGPPLLEYLQDHLIESGNLLVAAVGLPVLIWHVRGVHRGIETQTRNIQAQTLGCLYNHYFTLCRTLLRRPHLRGYLYDGALMATVPADDKRRSQVDTVCEMMTGLLEHAVLQQPNIPPDSWSNCWQPFLKEMYKKSDSELAGFYRKNRHFYSKDFQRVVDPLVATKNAGLTTGGQALAPLVCPTPAPPSAS